MDVSAFKQMCTKSQMEAVDRQFREQGLYSQLDTSEA